MKDPVEDDATVRGWANERVTDAVDAVESVAEPDPEQRFGIVSGTHSGRFETQRDRIPEDRQVDREGPAD